MQVEWIILAIVFLWLFAAYFHYYLVPELDDSKMKEILEFILEYKRIDFKSAHPLPRLNIVTPKSPSPEMTWEEWAAVADYIDVGYYDPNSKRMVLLEGCRQNILVHEIAHFVQYEYSALPTTGDEMQDEAWEITRAFFKRFYPGRYRILTILSLGIFHWWSSMPY